MNDDGMLLVAIDLGSNSFRMEQARSTPDRIRPLQTLKETVRLGGGLNEHAVLDQASMERGWDCLRRFRAAIAPERVQVRAVATHALRAARNRDAFLAHATELLGYPIDVIDGHEEARLIYRGVTHLLAPSHERRLVVDIGGGSTELILGHASTITYTGSFALGSVNWSLRYFPQGEFTPLAFEMAQAAARTALAAALPHCATTHWDIAYGSAGTVGALLSALQAAGRGGDVIDADGLDWLQARLLQAGHASRLALPGLKDHHRSVIGGGLSVMRAVLELLAIRQLRLAHGGLCQGVLSELHQRHGRAHPPVESLPV